MSCSRGRSCVSSSIHGWDQRKDDGMLENSDQLVLICSAGIPPPPLHAVMFRKSGSDQLLLH